MIITENLKTLLNAKILTLDGAMGTLLQAKNLSTDNTHWFQHGYNNAVQNIHAAYRAAGADILTTDTFQANEHSLKSRVSDVIHTAVSNARQAGDGALIALDAGPLGPMMPPVGTLSFDEAYRQYRDIAKAGEDAGADLFLVETVSDLLEMKAALLAARENTSLPVVCSMTYNAGGRTYLGTDSRAAALTLGALGATALGVNCSLGPDAFEDIFARFSPYAAIPLLAQPNAGMPDVNDGKTSYRIGAEDFADKTARLAELYELRLAGGCCGTSPEYIAALSHKLRGMNCARSGAKLESAITSRAGFISISTLPGTAQASLPVHPNADPDDLCAQASDLAETAELLWLEAANDIRPDSFAALTQAVQAFVSIPLGFRATESAQLIQAARCYAGIPILELSASGAEQRSLCEQTASCAAIHVGE